MYNMDASQCNFSIVLLWDNLQSVLLSAQAKKTLLTSPHNLIGLVSDMIAFNNNLCNISVQSFKHVGFLLLGETRLRPEY